MENGDKTVTTVGTFPNKATQFSSTNQPEKNGRPVGSISLETRVRRLLDGTEKLPPAIDRVIKEQCGENKRAIDAVFIVGLLQALQGDKNWGQFIVERGWGKVPDKLEGGDPNNPVRMSIGWMD